MALKDFVDVGVLEKSIYKRTSKVMNFMDARILNFELSYMEGFKMSASYTNPTNKVKLMPGRKKYSPKEFNLAKVDFPRKYFHPNPLSDKKLKDLKEIVSYIAPAEKAEYFYQIFREQDQAQVAASTSREPPEEDEMDPILDYDD